MNILRSIVTELIGLFVDDGWFAISIIAWVGAFALLRSHLPPALLFAGLAILVVVFARRRAVHLSQSKEKKNP